MSTIAARYDAGTKLTAALLNARQPLSAHKTTNEPVTSSITLHNDAELFVALEANTMYTVQLELRTQADIDAVTAIDIRVAWSLPAGSTVNGRQCFGPALDATAMTSTDIRSSGNRWADNVAYGVDNSISSIWEYGCFSTGAVAGNLQLRWAQNTSNANAVSVLSDSVLIVERAD
jgi:hypothetical protein